MGVDSGWYLIMGHNLFLCHLHFIANNNFIRSIMNKDGNNYKEKREKYKLYFANYLDIHI